MRFCFDKTAYSKTSHNFEDNLDRVKVFHETGLWEQSIQLLDEMKDDIENDSFTGKVLTEYLEQESKERQDIRYTPKEIGDIASSHYKISVISPLTIFYAKQHYYRLSIPTLLLLS